MPLDTTLDLLDESKALLVDRGRDYGEAHEHHSATAEMFRLATGHELTTDEVAIFFVCDKLVRRKTSPDKRDHYADGVNYLALAWGHRQE